MSRRKSAASLAREKFPDSTYKSMEIAQLINMIMKDGKKQLATKITMDALDKLYEMSLKQEGRLAKAIKKKDAKEEDGEDSGSEGAKNQKMDLSGLEKKAVIVDLFNDVLEKAGPQLELVSKRVGGANIQVPIMVRADRKATLALRFIIKNARQRISQLKSMSAALAAEMIDVMNETGKTIVDKENLHKMAKANAVFQGVRR